MTTFVETEQFNKMISYEPFAKTKSEKKKEKYNLLDSIQEALGDKWERLKEGTRQTFDMICFLSAERGFFYASDEYLADQHDISDRTVRNRLKELITLGQVVKVHKRSKKCNGKGKPIYLFVNHPYFKEWINLLGLDFHTDFHTENAEISWESKVEEQKKVSTYLLPSFFKNNHLNTKRTAYIKFVPKILQHYQAFFGEQVKDIYGRIWMAAKKLNVHRDNYETMQEIGFIALEQLKQYIKGGKQLTKDEINKIAYKIGYNQLKQRKEDGDLYEPENMSSESYNDWISWISMPKTVIKTAVSKPFEKASKEELDELGVW
jgi:hypothetical protein